MAGANTGGTYRGVLAVRDFRYLWLADLLSVAGDQLGRVALSILVFARTNSAALTGLTYGLTFVPTLLGSVFLSGFADHYARRNVMIACDLFRAALMLLVVLPGMPLWLLCILVACSTAFNGPFKAAQSATLPDILHGRLYVLGVSLRTVSNQAAQLSGFAIGGVVVTFLTPAGGLVFDAATFGASALLLLLVRPRPADPQHGERALSGQGLLRGASAVLADRRLLVLVGVGALNLFHIIPEGIAAPYADQLHIGRWAVAVIQASAPLGAVIGAFVFGRIVPESSHAKLVGPAAIGASLSLVPLFAPVGLPVSLALFAIAGGLSGIYSMYSSAMIAQLAPQRDRGRVTGVDTAVMQTANGLGPTLGGIVAGAYSASFAIATAGVVSALLAIAVSFAWAHARRVHTVSTEQQPVE